MKCPLCLSTIEVFKTTNYNLIDCKNCFNFSIQIYISNKIKTLHYYHFVMNDTRISSWNTQNASAVMLPDQTHHMLEGAYPIPFNPTKEDLVKVFKKLTKFINFK